MLELKHVNKTFLKGMPDEVLALSDITLSVEPGQFLTIVGSNGAGKSTLLNAIVGFCSVDAGTITLLGKDITHTPPHEKAKCIGRIAQDPGASVCGVMTIEENLSMAAMRGQKRGLRLAVTPTKRASFRQILPLLGLGLEDRLSVRVSTLSGGQRQALALLMATMARPQVLVLDEHIASLDPRTATQVMNLTNELVEEARLTTLMVTHNMAAAIQWGDRLIMMHHGRVIFDVCGQEKRALTVADLTAKFRELSQAELVTDRMLLL